MSDPIPNPTLPEEPKDLGFGTVVGGEHQDRLLNRDGSFNVRRTGLPFWESLSLYHTALTTTWPRFLGVLVGGYLSLNVLFALAYLACGPNALSGPPAAQFGGAFFKAFFFSVDTFATIGYGNIPPVGLVPNLLVTVESVVSLLGFAAATGFVFARFSRPIGRILFSRTAVIAPYHGGSAFMFRIANMRTNQLIELEAKVLFTRLDGAGRRYHQLALERRSVVFFPLSWTIVHPITEDSPLWGLTQQDLASQEAEFLILLSGTDETFAQSVHARTSYKPNEVIWGARFSNIYTTTDNDGSTGIDVARLHDVEPAPLTADPQVRRMQNTGHFVAAVPPKR